VPYVLSSSYLAFILGGGVPGSILCHMGYFLIDFHFLVDSG